MRKALLALAVVSLSSVAGAQAPSPAGGEFRINGFTTAEQMLPAAAADQAGRFVVVWRSRGEVEPGYYATVGRRLDPAGRPLGDEFIVNQFTTGAPSEPGIAVAADGRFLVVWQEGAGRPGRGVFARAFAASGQPLGPQFTPSTTSGKHEGFPRVAAIA